MIFFSLRPFRAIPFSFSISSIAKTKAKVKRYFSIFEKSFGEVFYMKHLSPLSFYII